MREEVLIEYFYNHPIGTELPVLTMLSSLPPCKRIYILERVAQNDEENLIIIDKLSMAYLKNGDKMKALQYLEEQRTKQYIDETLYHQFIEKIEMLEQSMNSFDIAKNVLDVTRIFGSLFSPQNYNMYPEFVNIFLALVTGYNKILEDNTEVICPN